MHKYQSKGFFQKPPSLGSENPAKELVTDEFRGTIEPSETGEHTTVLDKVCWYESANLACISTPERYDTGFILSRLQVS